MSGQEIESRTLLPSITVDAATRRRAAVRIADHVAAEHPHPLDEHFPAIAGAVIAKDPAVRGEVGDLLDQLGLKASQIRRTS